MSKTFPQADTSNERLDFIKRSILETMPESIGILLKSELGELARQSIAAHSYELRVIMELYDLLAIIEELQQQIALRDEHIETLEKKHGII